MRSQRKWIKRSKRWEKYDNRGRGLTKEIQPWIKATPDKEHPRYEYDAIIKGIRENFPDLEMDLSTRGGRIYSFWSTWMKRDGYQDKTDDYFFITSETTRESFWAYPQRNECQVGWPKMSPLLYWIKSLLPRGKHWLKQKFMGQERQAPERHSKQLICQLLQGEGIVHQHGTNLATYTGSSSSCLGPRMQF